MVHSQSVRSCINISKGASENVGDGYWCRSCSVIVDSRLDALFCILSVITLHERVHKITMSDDMDKVTPPGRMSAALSVSQGKEDTNDDGLYVDWTPEEEARAKRK